MIEKRRKNAAGGRRTPKSGKKKSAGKWFSLDSLVGKSLCILLVVILTVGAFLAPKMINNLYDAGTLMQITYMDLDLSTYVVPYVSFQEKIIAIARAETAGEKLTVLPAEESDEKISDEELAGIVNEEIDRGGADFLFREDWWSELTEENLVSRQKVTAYAQAQMNGQEGGSGWEMAPIQFWILSFEITEEQKQENLAEMLYGYMPDESKAEAERMEQEIVALAKSGVSKYATDRLIVCLDAEFYKIYAMALAGDAGKINNTYGWELWEMFRVEEYTGQEASWDDWTDMLMYLTDQGLADWADYWEAEPENRKIYMDIPGEISGCMVFSDEKNVAEGRAAGADSTEAESGDMAFDDSKAAAGGVEMYEEYYGSYIVNSAQEALAVDGIGDGEILLEVGCRGEFDKIEEELWIQKSGCREFFEMMQF